MPQDVSLFENLALKSRPLADKLRPKVISEIVGQEHLLGEGKPLALLLQSKNLPSLILWGPPGCGKTTLARLLAREIGAEFESVSAIVGGVADLKKVFETAKENRMHGKRTLLFVDEIHRFNRAQQDVFLSSLEEGIITLVGATTQNPSFELNAALLSRCRVLVLQRLEENDLEALLQKAEDYNAMALPLTLEARTLLIQMADGDGRTLLNFAESLFMLPKEKTLDPHELLEVLQKRAPIYDKAQEGHYNLISALHKSIRGSDPDAALYWFCRMIEAGEDPLFIARRLVRAASEDIGLADPGALTQAIAAKEAYEFLGSPEGELAIVQCLIYLATAPKSNAAYMAYKGAVKTAKNHGSLSPPKHILNAPTPLMKDLGYGKDYIYDHNAEEEFSGQSYFPEELPRRIFYNPKGKGFEDTLLKRLKHWQSLRGKPKTDEDE
ncbi:MAG: replication-associated recombination protein A [Alphaproteobacteria bacterium]|nr:replication-associated recombination protein A [Alphaproteobacteria bacterium]